MRVPTNVIRETTAAEGSAVMFGPPDPSERQYNRGTRKDRWVWLIYIPFAALAIGAIGWLFHWDFKNIIPTLQLSKNEVLDPEEGHLAIYQRLRMKPLKLGVTKVSEIDTALRDLSAAPCDKTAVFRLSQGLLTAGEKLGAAEALLGFSAVCPNSEGELYAGANILFNMGDYAKALPIFDQLVAQRPEVGQYYYSRGQAHQFLGKHQDAIEDFTSAMGLVDDQKLVSSQVFTQLAAAYSAAGRNCEAMTAIQSYVFIDASSRDTAPSRKLISDYASKGKCDNTYAKGKEVIRKSNNNVILAKVLINGVAGNFVIDTGASLVSVDQKFAKKAQLTSDSGRTIRMNTANGPSEASLQTAKSVQLGSVNADAVAIAVIEKPIASGVDGLLGMSFLARFDVILNERELVIQSRASADATGATAKQSP